MLSHVPKIIVLMPSLVKDQSLQSLAIVTGSQPTSNSSARDLPDSVRMKVTYYFYHGLASSTQCTYSAPQRQFLEFCTQHQLQALPASQYTLQSFAARSAQGLKPQSIPVYLAAIRALRIAHGLDLQLKTSPEGHQYIALRLETSKTDQFRRGPQQPSYLSSLFYVPASRLAQAKQHFCGLPPSICPRRRISFVPSNPFEILFSSNYNFLDLTP